LRVFGVIYSCTSILPCWYVLESHKVRIVFLLKASLEFNVNFSLVPDAADVHYNFQAKKHIMSFCSFYVNFVGKEAFIFLETCTNCRVLSILIVIFLCYLLQQTSIITFRLKNTLWVVHFRSVLLVKHLFFLETCANCRVLSISTVIFPCYLLQQTSIITFRLKKRLWVVHFMSVLLVKHLFFLETCANCRVLSISTIIFSCYLLQQTSIITFKLKKRLWVLHFMSVLLVKHLFFKRRVQITECYQFWLWFFHATCCRRRPLLLLD